MSNNAEISQVNKKTAAILATDSTQDKLEGNSRKRIAEELLKESTNYSSDSQAKSEEARKYLNAADALEKLANAVRIKAEQLKNNEIKKEDAVKEIVEAAGAVLQMPIPKDATPEMLEKMADDLEAKAKDNRRKADDLLKIAEESSKISKQLKEHAELLTKKI